MNFNECLENGQKIEFKIKTGITEYVYTAHVTEVLDAVVKILPDKTENLSKIYTSLKGTVKGKKDNLQFVFDVEVLRIKEFSEIELQKVPSRAYSRVNAFVVLDYEIIKDKQILEKKIKYINNISCSPETYNIRSSVLQGEEGETVSGMPSEMTTEIQRLHRKLDYIIRLLSSPEEDNVFIREPVEINLSGSGLKFISADALHPGDFMEIKMILPGAADIIIELIGKVVRVKELCIDTDGCVKKSYEAALNFFVVKEDDREYIIRYVFKRQRELLRSEESSSK